MSNIFLSYSHQDNEIASELIQQLRQQGYESVFLDRDRSTGIPPGTEWEPQLRSRLRRSKALLALVSESYIDSKWCFAEFMIARVLGTPVIPLRITDCEVNKPLSDIQILDFTPPMRPDGYDRLWARLREVDLLPADSFEWRGLNPFPGLTVMGEEHAAVYFGRTADIREMMKTLNEWRAEALGLMVIVGASGCGKSSFVRAGLLPRLKHIDEQRRWISAEPFRPERRPFDNLLDVLMRLSGGPARRVRELLQRSDGDLSGLFEFGNELRDAADRPSAAVLVVIDQLEELLSPEAGETEKRFLSLLGRIARDPQSPFLFLGTLRSYYLEKFETHPALQNAKMHLSQLVPMGAVHLGEVIQGPADLVGINLDPGLAQRMVIDTGSGNALPLLAFTLNRMWELNPSHFTLNTYEKIIGGVTNSVGARADEVCRQAGLTREKENHLRSAFLKLVNLVDGRYVRRTARWSEVPEEARDLVEALVKGRLLTSSTAGTERTVEVAHEALFDSWHLAEDWLKSDQEFLQFRERVERYMKDEEPLPARITQSAARWIRERPQDFTPSQIEYLRAGLTENERKHQMEVVRKLTGEAAMVARRGPAGSMASMLLAAESLRRFPTRESEGMIRDALALLPQCHNRLPHRSPVTAIAHSMDQIASASEDGAVKLWDVSTGGELVSAQHASSRVNSLAFSADGKWLASAGDDNTARIWDTATGREIVRMEHEYPVGTVEFSSDSKLLLSMSGVLIAPGCGQAGVASIWDSGSGQLLGSLPHSQMTAALFSPDGAFVVTASHQNRVIISEAATGKPFGQLLHQKPVAAVAVHPRTWPLASLTLDGKLFLWSKTEGNGVDGQEIAQSLQPASRLLFSPDGRWLAATSSSYEVRIWDISTGCEMPRRQHQSMWIELTFAPKSPVIASASQEEGVIRVWDVVSGRMLSAFAQDSARAVVFSPLGESLLTASDQNAVWVWNLPAKYGAIWTGYTGPGGLIKFSADGSRLVWTGLVIGSEGRLVANDQNCVLKVLAAFTGNEIFSIVHPERIEAVSISSDGNRVGWADRRQFFIYDLNTGREVQKGASPPSLLDFWINSEETRFLTKHRSVVSLHETLSGRTLAFPHEPEHMLPATDLEGGRIATVSGDIVTVWDAVSGSELSHFRADTPVQQIALTGTGQWLVTVAHDVQIREAATCELICRFTAASPEWFAAVSSDRNRIATIDENSLQLWDSASGEEWLTLRHGEKVGWVAFSPDLRLLASLTVDGELCVWPLSTDQLLLETASRATRSLTAEETPVDSKNIS